MEKRLGFVGIIIEDRKKSAPEVNKILTEYGELIVARTGIPYPRRKCCVITLIVESTNDELGAITGKIGKVAGVTVKSSLAKELNNKSEQREQP
jgi:putative iron-only hydrogenase system regulator